MSDPALWDWDNETRLRLGNEVHDGARDKPRLPDTQTHTHVTSLWK